MTDIADRLDALAIPPPNTCSEGAAEIRRLRDALKDYQCVAGLNAHLLVDKMRLSGEVEDLREKIAGYNSPTMLGLLEHNRILVEMLDEVRTRSTTLCTEAFIEWVQGTIPAYQPTYTCETCKWWGAEGEAIEWAGPASAPTPLAAYCHAYDDEDEPPPDDWRSRDDSCSRHSPKPERNSAPQMPQDSPVEKKHE